MSENALGLSFPFAHLNVKFALESRTLFAVGFNVFKEIPLKSLLLYRESTRWVGINLACKIDFYAIGFWYRLTLYSIVPGGKANYLHSKANGQCT